MLHKDGKGYYVEGKNSRVRYIGTKLVQQNNKVSPNGAPKV